VEKESQLKQEISELENEAVELKDAVDESKAMIAETTKENTNLQDSNEECGMA
jgi:cell division septum initiation protein DivIVA